MLSEICSNNLEFGEFRPTLDQRNGKSHISTHENVPASEYSAGPSEDLMGRTFLLLSIYNTLMKRGCNKLYFWNFPNCQIVILDFWKMNLEDLL